MACWSAENATKAYLKTLKMVSVSLYFTWILDTHFLVCFQLLTNCLDLDDLIVGAKGERTRRSRVYFSSRRRQQCAVNRCGMCRCCGLHNAGLSCRSLPNRRACGLHPSWTWRAASIGGSSRRRRCIQRWICYGGSSKAGINPNA